MFYAQGCTEEFVVCATCAPRAIKQYGRQVANYNDTIWNGIRQIVVYKGLLAKFSQNEALRENLRKTGSAILAECAVKDRGWGIVNQWRYVYKAVIRNEENG